MSIYSLHLDFESDWKHILHKRLTDAGYSVSLDLRTDEVSIKYFNLLKRGVPMRRRKILLSDEFACPIEYLNGLETIKQKIESGESLYPYLSKGIINLDYDDLLLNDWGIHHLHLGTIPDSRDSKFIMRTQFLLFVKFDYENAYFINVLDHGTWANEEIIEIVHRNWSHLLKRFHIEGIKLDRPITEEARTQHRKAGSFLMTQTRDGTVYFPPGGGISTAKTCVEVVTASDRHFTYIIEIEKFVRNNFELLFLEAIRERTDYKGNRFVFFLLLNGNQILTIEFYSGMIFELGSFDSLAE